MQASTCRTLTCTSGGLSGRRGSARGIGIIGYAGRSREGGLRMGVVMVMFRADQQRRSFSVTRDMTVIGRREDCDLRIPLSDVSRKHCRMILDGETIKVEDLGSSNGTYRNGERVQQTERTAGYTLQIGPV